MVTACGANHTKTRRPAQVKAVLRTKEATPKEYTKELTLRYQPPAPQLVSEVARPQAVDKPDGQRVWPVLEAAFREVGLPEVIRSDNGPPFASTAAGGLGRPNRV